MHILTSLLRQCKERRCLDKVFLQRLPCDLPCLLLYICVYVYIHIHTCVFLFEQYPTQKTGTVTWVTILILTATPASQQLALQTAFVCARVSVCVCARVCAALTLMRQGMNLTHTAALNVQVQGIPSRCVFVESY